MNVKPLEEVAEWLEAGAPHKAAVRGFNMCEGIAIADVDKCDPYKPFAENANVCGTVCCIAGALVAFDEFNRLKDEPVQAEYSECDTQHFYLGWQRVTTRAAEITGIQPRVANALFEPRTEPWGKIRQATPAQAAQVIRNFIATGAVDWDAVLGESNETC